MKITSNTDSTEPDESISISEAIDLNVHPLNKSTMKRRIEYYGALSFAVHYAIAMTDNRNKVLLDSGHDVMIKQYSNANNVINQDYVKSRLHLYCLKFGIADENDLSFKINQKTCEDFSYYISRPQREKYRNCLICDVSLILVNKILVNNAAYLIRKKLTQTQLTSFNNTLHQLFDDNVKINQKMPLIPQFRKNNMFFRQPCKRILVTANMSAGKSMLINALAGRKISKSQNDACTAKIHSIYNKPFEDGCVAENDNLLNLTADNYSVMTDDDNNSTNNIDVGAYFNSVIFDGARLCIVDTPGVNYSQDKAHEEITKEFVSSAENYTIIYVINAENSGTDDEKRYMSFIAKYHKNDRVLFAVNKLDHFSPSQDNICDTVSRIKDDVCKLGFTNAFVCPVSSYAGYMAKKVISGVELDEDDTDEIRLLTNKYKNPYYDLLQFYPADVQELCRRLVVEKYNNIPDKYVQLLLNCGILPLEIIILKTGEKK